MKNQTGEHALPVLKKANWDGLQNLMTHLKNNLDFYFLDLNSLENLLEFYFPKLVVQENLDEIRELQQSVMDLKAQCDYLKKRLQIDLDGKEAYLQNPSVFSFENHELEDEIHKFVTEENDLEKVVFSMVQEVLGTETADSLQLN